MINVRDSRPLRLGRRRRVRLNVWREPELAALQSQLAEVDLLPLVRKSFELENRFAAQDDRSQFFPQAGGSDSAVSQHDLDG